MTTQLEDVLATALADHQLLSHPFYRRWEAGTLQREELTRYAEQYRFFEAMLPSFLENLSGLLPVGPVRDAVAANLSDEVSSPSHLELFEQFARSFDASEAPISPAMAHLVDSYAKVLELGPEASLAGLWAYESQGARIADSKADGLLKHYEAQNDDIAFWTAHGSIEEDHAKWTLDALAMMEPNPSEVESSTRLIGDAWWSFLDERESLAA
jgi:pyrroloquinoline quinone (PQQ) biosynthesis protein C